MNQSMGRWESLAYALGLALLYTSAYYLPYVGVSPLYWTADPLLDILVPTFVGTAVLIPLTWYVLSTYIREPRQWHDAIQVPVAVLIFVAVLGVFSSAGYNALDLVLRWSGPDIEAGKMRWTRTVAVAITFAIIAVGVLRVRERRESVVRVLSLLGFTFALLAAMRIVGFSPSRPAPHVAQVAQVAQPAPASVRPREVVWMIFDETDFNQTLGPSGFVPAGRMPNLAKLSHAGMSATRAFSPARDTEVSIPSLLLGEPPFGIRFNNGGLSILRSDNSREPFDEAHSVFKRLPGGPASAAILGFYHPYCRVFPTVRPCTALSVENTGRWFDALIPFGARAMDIVRLLPHAQSYVPDALFRLLAPFYRISEVTLQELPGYLQLPDKSLIYLHINLPHPPGDFVQRFLGFTTAVDEREAYRRNLLLVDQVVGNTVATLRAQAQQRDILLIVSSDHWHRIDSPHVVEPIPWIAWHVDEESGAPIEEKISTVHTADLAIDFLEGNIKSQQDIIGWWRGKSTQPPLMPEQYGN